MSETPFKIDIPDSEINLLRQKLELARLPDELEEAGWAYGVPLADVKRLVDKWRATFDWKKHEAEINKLPMFTRDIEIDGFGSLNIHYVHQKSTTEGAIPLLFIHGCRSTLTLFGCCVLIVLLTRAGSLPGGRKNPTTSCRFIPRLPKFPCCRIQLTWFRFL